MDMGSAFRRTVARFPNRTAVVDADEDVAYTYDEWGERVTALAAALSERGVEQGDRVGAIMQPRVQMATLYWAIQQVGAVYVPLNIRAAADEIEFLVNNTDPELLVYSSVAREAVDGAYEAFDRTEDLVYVDDDVPAYATPYETLFEDPPVDSFAPADVDRDDTSVILHTSGTTGRPKGVPRSHENTYAASTAHAIQSEWSDGESILGLMPLYHTMGLRTLATAVILSGKFVAQRSFDPEQTVELLEAESVSGLYLVPTVFHDLVKYDGIADADLDSVEHLGYAGTPMSKPVQKKVRETFDPDIFVNHYGSTEIYTYSVCSWIDEKPGCAGRAGINTAVRVVTPKEGETVPPTDTTDPNELGEIIVDASSPEAFDGYLDRPDADAKSFRDGWYFTGDLGYQDEDGDLFVVGRVDDMIISGGENIYPVEVEDVLDAHDDIDEVAIVGVDDERWNQVVTAFVQPVADPSKTDFEAFAARLDEYCRGSDDLADFKRPRKYVFVDDIAKSNVGKVLRRKLDPDSLDATVYANVDV